MRRLLILRHAKSDWPGGTQDFDRPLARRGQAAAPVMGRYLKSEGLMPDFAIVSAARRTIETWELVRAELGEETPFRIESSIYEAPVERLFSVVRDAAPAVATLLIVGHNPGCEELASDLTGYGDRFAAQRMGQKYPTAGLAVLDFDIDDWSLLAERSGRLDRFVTPAALGQGPDE